MNPNIKVQEIACPKIVPIIENLETFLEEEIIEDVYHYMDPLWRGATKLLKSKLEEDE